MKRRTYLQTLDTVGIGAAPVGCDTPDEETPTETPRPTEEVPTPEPGLTVFDVVDGLGTDPTRQEPVDDIPDETYDDDMAIEFPSDDCLVTHKHDWSRGVSNFRLVGLGGSHKDVQFVFPLVDLGEWFRMSRTTSETDHVLKNLSIQQTDGDTTSADIWLASDNGALIEDVEWFGRTPTNSHARDQLPLFSYASVEGVDVIRHAYMRGDATFPGYPNGVAGVRITERLVGEIRMINCHIERHGSSSFRVAHTRDVLHVEGSLFKNNDNTSIRISAGNHPEKTSWIEGATVIADVDNLNERAREGDRLDNPEGLRIGSAGHDYTGVLIEDCDFVYRSSPSSPGITTVPTYGGHDGFTMRNCRIVNDTGVQTICTGPVGTDIVWEPWGVSLGSVAISGACEGQSYGSAVVVDENQNGSRIVGSCVYLPSDRVDDVLVNRVSGRVIERSSISVSGPPTRTRGVELALDDMTYTTTYAFRDE